MNKASWSARVPWFPEPGVDLEEHLCELKSKGAHAVVEEVFDDYFTVRVWAGLCNVVVTFRKPAWRGLSPTGRIAWVERDLQDGARMALARERKILAKLKDDKVAMVAAGRKRR